MSTSLPVDLSAHYNDVSSVLKNTFKKCDKVTFSSCFCGDGASSRKKWPTPVKQLADDVRQSLGLSQHLGPTQCCMVKLSPEDRYLYFSPITSILFYGVRGVVSAKDFDLSQLIGDGPIVIVIFDEKCLIALKTKSNVDWALFESPVCIVAAGDFREYVTFR